MNHVKPFSPSQTKNILPSLHSETNVVNLDAWDNLFSQGSPSFIAGDPPNCTMKARFLSLISAPKIIAIGRNYAAHAKELGNSVPDVNIMSYIDGV